MEQQKDMLINYVENLDEETIIPELKEISPLNIYTFTTMYNLPYDEEFSVKKAYEYLKSLQIYKGALDV